MTKRKAKDHVTLVVTLAVRYWTHGELVEDLSELLRPVVERAVGDSLLAGDSPAEIDGWACNVLTLED